MLFCFRSAAKASFLYAPVLSACFEAKGDFHYRLCRRLRETPLYAILSGFSVDDTPGVGTFYDFFARLWKDASNNLSPKDRFPKMKPPKGKKKGDKTPCDSSSIASRLLPLLERWNLKPENPFWLIFKLYNQQFLSKSVEHGLIDSAHLSLAGDGTPVRTAAQQRKKAALQLQG